MGVRATSASANWQRAVALGSEGGRCLGVADYVTVMRPTDRRSPEAGRELLALLRRSGEWAHRMPYFPPRRLRAGIPPRHPLLREPKDTVPAETNHAGDHVAETVLRSERRHDLVLER